MKLELWKPAKPFNITQAFGIYNPAYLQFGFDHHNGIDFTIESDGLVHAMCDGVVYETGFNSGAGNFVRYKTEPLDAEGHTAPVGFMYMHGKEILVKTGDKVLCGDSLMIADNTGFSTGPHTHISAYLIAPNGLKIPLDASTDNCFDFSKYFNGFYAVDVAAVKDNLSQQISLLSKVVGLLKSLFK